MLSRKHYRMIADTLALVRHRVAQSQDDTAPANAALDMVADYLAGDFKADNPNFNRERFLDACRHSKRWNRA